MDARVKEICIEYLYARIEFYTAKIQDISDIDKLIDYSISKKELPILKFVIRHKFPHYFR